MIRRLAVLSLIAVVLATASMYVQRTRLEVQDWDCPPAPASCARPVLVGGFPLVFVSDYHGISVVNSISLSGALLGEDLFHWPSFLGNVLFYLMIAAGASAIMMRYRRRAER